MTLITHAPGIISTVRASRETTTRDFYVRRPNDRIFSYLTEVQQAGEHYFYFNHESLHPAFGDLYNTTIRALGVGDRFPRYEHRGTEGIIQSPTAGSWVFWDFEHIRVPIIHQDRVETYRRYTRTSSSMEEFVFDETFDEIAMRRYLGFQSLRLGPLIQKHPVAGPIGKLY